MGVAGTLRSPRLRVRVRTAIVTVAAVAVAAFGVPLAVAVQRVVHDEALTGLQRDATRAVATVPDNMIETGSAVTVAPAGDATRLAVYDAAGRRVSGAGPAASALAAAARDGREHDGRDGGDLAVVVPVLSDTTVAGSVRASVASAVLWRRTLLGWAALAGLAALVLLAVAVVARRLAGLISRPFEEITGAARALGAGAFDVRLPHWGLAEADAAGSALRDSGRRIGELVRVEREFTRHASHQLKTPLSGLLLGLEDAVRRGTGSQDDLRAALGRARHLETTIDDLLAVRAGTTDRGCDPVPLARAAVDRARASFGEHGRTLTLRVDSSAGPVDVPEPAVRQAVEVLLDNALRHGAGATTVTVEPLGAHVVVEVADAGAGLAAGSRPGTGLRLATELMQAHGGDLLIRRQAPHPRVALLMPARQSSS